MFTPATQVFLRIFQWSLLTNKKPGHFHQPAGTPGHGHKTETYGKSTFLKKKKNVEKQTKLDEKG